MRGKMKVEKVKKEFEPVAIILENNEDLIFMKNVLDLYRWKNTLSFP